MTITLTWHSAAMVLFVYVPAALFWAVMAATIWARMGKRRR